MTNRMARNIVAALGGILGLAFVAGPTEAQQAPAYATGKLVSVYVATAAGGTADFTMRMIAQHIGKHLPGQPTVVPKNMLGAGSRKLAEYLYSQAAKDGTEFGLLLRPIATDPLFADADAAYDVQKLVWLGSPSPVTDVCGFWHTAPIQSFDEMKTKELVIPAIGAEAGEAVQSSILRQLTGVKIRTVIGYQSGGEMALAVERGEAHGRCALSWEAIKSTYPDYIAKKQFKPFVQFALERHKELPDVPAIMEMAKAEIDKQALDVILAPQSFGFPLAAPPGISAQTADILRKALQATMTDPAFLADAAKRKFEIDFVPHTRLESILKSVYGYPPAVIDRAKALISSK